MILALAGGVGGAKLAQGLALALPPGDLTVVVNTGDDFDLFGLRICPDLDTVLYTLAGLANPATGWGIERDTRATLDAIGRYGRELWFQLGDQDFATHILRTERLRHGAPLSSVTAEFADALGVATRIAPMTDDPVATLVQTPDGVLDFQTYFVGRRQRDAVTGLEFRGAATARPSQAALDGFDAAELIVLCPSNPLVSIGPILAVPSFRARLAGATVPRVAVSPIVGGKALKGPADKMLATLGHDVSSVGVARLYQGLIDGLIIDGQDRELRGEIEALGLRVLVTQSVMGGPDDRARLARETLAFGRSLQPAGAAA